jgi:predicted dehydrogenase
LGSPRGKQETKGPLRAGLLGTGVIAAPHALSLRSIPGVEIAAVCDLDSRKAEQFQRQWQIPQAFSNLNEMLSAASLDVVHVLLPPSAHMEAALQCLRAKCHIFVEKPFCLSSEDCRRVTETAKNENRLVGVNHNLTYMPGVLELISAVREYRIGAVEHVTVVYNLPMPALAGGQHGHWMFGETERLILELGPHPVSVICRLLGGVEQAATAVSGKTMLTNGRIFFHTWQSSLVCERGTAQLLLSVGRDYPNMWIHALGQDGEIFVDLRRNTTRISEKTQYQRTDNIVDAWRNSSKTMSAALGNFKRYFQGALGLKPPFELQNESMRGSIGAFYDALARGVKAPVGAAEGTDVVRGCEAIFESAPEAVPCSVRIK